MVGLPGPRPDHRRLRLVTEFLPASRVGGSRRPAVAGVREQAPAALADGIRACIHCRPDTELGVLGQPGSDAGEKPALCAR
ncbi:DUF6233 domain-containing protein [Streptomyces sp. NPDC055681]